MATSEVEDRGLCRLIACLFLLLGLTLAAYGAYTTLWRIPTHREMFTDFGMGLPNHTMFLMQNRWIPLGICALSVTASTLALLHARLWTLALAGIACVVATALLLLAQWALDAPMVKLVTPIQGG